MTRYLSLVKLLLTQQYRIKPTNGKKKRGRTILLFVVLGICLLPMLISLVLATYFLGKFAGRDIGIGALLILVSQGLVLLFGTISVITNVFNSKDADRLLYLPVRSITIFAAKMSVVYLNEVFTTAALILFAMVPFGIGANMAAGYYLMMPFTLLLVPVLPLFVGTLFAIPISALLSKIRNNGVVKVILQTLLFVGIMTLYILLYTNILGSPEGGEMSSDIETSINSLIEHFRKAGEKMVYIHPDMMLSTAMMASAFSSWILSFALTLVENLALLVIIILVALPFYRWILAGSLETIGGRRRKKNGEALQVKSKGVLKELISTDFKRIVRNGQMGFQALGGLVMLPLLVVFMYLVFNSTGEDGTSLVQTMASNSMYQMIAPLCIVVYMSLLGMSSNMLGLYPISRENKSLYLLKSMPIPFNKILLAKVILAMSILLASDLITCILVVVLFGIKWYYGIGMIILMALLGFGGMCVTTLLDLKSPKLGWTNFNQGLKNAKNSWIAMLVGFLVSMSITALAAGFVVWALLARNATETALAISFMWVVVIGAATAFAALSYKIMTQNAAQNFAKIEP